MTRPRLQSLIRRGGDRVARLPIPRRVIVSALPMAIPRRFDASQASDLNATFELRVLDPQRCDPTRFGVHVAAGRCSVSPGPASEAGAGVSVSAADLIRLASGAVGWPELLAKGRLELSGDPFLALRFPTLFGLPASGRI